MNTKQLRYVITLAREGSFSKAADVLNVSQPSLSQYIKTLEKQLGTELFDRTNSNLRLTNAGRVFVEDASKMVDIENQLMDKLTDIENNVTGSIIVGTTPFRCSTMMPRIVADFNKCYPGMNIVVVEKGNEELKAAVESGECDMCITTSSFDEKLFECYNISQEEMVLAVNSQSELYDVLSDKCVHTDDARFELIDVSLLDNERFVMLTSGQIMQKSLDELCTECGINLKTAVVVKSLDAQKNMVLNNIGAALVPDVYAGQLEDDGKIRFFSLNHRLPKRNVVLLHRKDKYLSKAMKSLIDIVKSIEW